MVGIGVLTFFVPPLGAGAAVAYTSYSATNVIAGKNMITGRKYSKSERIIEGIGLIPIGKVFKGVGKPALNMISKTAGKTTAGQLMKSGLKNTTNMTTNRLIKLKTSYKVMMDKA
ncbi:pre-toxin TG domain-containing protein, partial [Macrococcus capreoli]|uniref:pre-toxin TG domain-containing protein n=1 Tax=Macrococcus capreoli TaxID=2982690 RepID=UPI003EE4926C